MIRMSSRARSPDTPSTSTTSTPTQARYATLRACSHLSQVLNSNAKDTVLRNFGLAAKVAKFNSLSQYESSTFKTSKGIIDHRKITKLKSRVLKCKDCHESLSSTFMCLQCPHVGCWSNHHFVNHAKASGHIFGIDSHLGHLFCFKCGDYTSDSQLEAVKEPTDELYEGDLVMKYSRSVNFKPTTGIRGFVNMGSTCFMSSVLQTLIHNPIIRDFFMTEGHLDCTKDSCLTCCINEIFTDFYTSNKTSGFGSVSLLNTSWKINKALAGYSEQDAHEFFQFLVNQLHQDLTKSQRNTNSCNCIVHKTFSSDLQSSITCLKCKNITTTIDPIIDISLGITQGDSLIDCLKNFTKSEILDIKYSCDVCNERTKAAKQLSFAKFPNVLAVQLKRFEHSNTSIKIDKFIKFPMFINMSEFASQRIDKHIDFALTYELFAIVCHIGSVNTGHYVTVIKNNRGEWFKFDDSVVTLLTSDQVSQLRAYLLFYIVSKVV